MPAPKVARLPPEPPLPPGVNADAFRVAKKAVIITQPTVTLTVYVPTQFTYLQTSTDLTNWSDLANFAGAEQTGGFYRLTNTFTNAQTFFRASAQP
jgi:hypothetical protein